ncbi:hypothetical protein [Amycolatopsis sp. NPDC021455]|uniref:hypothetical protein n=1 Tax=Amycolatopsis sp. NPDC021455 TaxID=3154901 RepID=UPI003403542E
MPKAKKAPEEPATDKEKYLDDPLYRMCREGHTWRRSGWQQIYNHPRANVQRTAQCMNKVGKRQCKFQKVELAFRHPDGAVTILKPAQKYGDKDYLVKGIRIYPRDVRAHEINAVFVAEEAKQEAARSRARVGGSSPSARVPRKAPAAQRRRKST